MNGKSIIPVILALALLVPALSLAGHPYGYHGCRTMNWNMDELDADNDGMLTFDEFTAPNLEKWRNGFDMIDANGDGEIDAEEWREFLDVHTMRKS